MERIAPLLSLIPIAGLIFQAGRQSERLDDLILKTTSLEADQKGIRDILYGINGKLSSMEQEIRDMARRLPWLKHSYVDSDWL